MEGLEATVARAKQLERTARIDAEFFEKRFLRSAALIEQWQRESVSDLAHVSDGNHFSISEHFVDDGVPYYRGQDVTGRFFVETASPIHITREAFDEKHMARSHLQKGDVLLSIIGTIGELSLVASEDPATCSCKLAILRPRATTPEYLAVFLRSEHGQNQIKRMIRGAIQKGLLLEDMDQLWVPAVSDEFERRIVRAVRTSRSLRDATTQKQIEAEGFLLDALSLADWTPPEPLSYTATATDVFSAGRIDAQYFRPLFSEVEERLLDTGSSVELGALVSVNARGRQPLYSDDGLPVVNSKHVRTNRVTLEGNRTAIETGSPVVIQNGDVLVNGTGVGTIGRAAPYLHQERALPDNHVTVLRTDEIDPIYLAAFLNSPLGQWQIERHIKGSSGQIELYPKDIARIVVWQAPEDVQDSVRHAIMSAFDEERRASELLDAAKHAVEIAIEEGEPSALAYLDTVEGES